MGFRHRGPRRLAVVGHFSLIPGSGRSTALRDRCRLPVRVVFLSFVFGVVAGGASCGYSGRCASCRPVVRFLQRAVLFEVGEDGADGGGFFDAGHDP